MIRYIKKEMGEKYLLMKQKLKMQFIKPAKQSI